MFLKLPNNSYKRRYKGCSPSEQDEHFPHEQQIPTHFAELSKIEVLYSQLYIVYLLQVMDSFLIESIIYSFYL